MTRFEQLNGKINKYYKIVNGKNEIDEITVDLFDGGQYTIGLGKINLPSTDAEIIISALQKYDALIYNRTNPPLPDCQELREKLYLEKGITPDKMLIALWEKVIEGRSETADSIQIQRVEIKNKIPKK